MRLNNPPGGLSPTGNGAGLITKPLYISGSRPDRFINDLTIIGRPETPKADNTNKKYFLGNIGYRHSNVKPTPNPTDSAVFDCANLRPSGLFNQAAKRAELPNNTTKYFIIFNLKGMMQSYALPEGNQGGPQRVYIQNYYHCTNSVLVLKAIRVIFYPYC